MARPLQVLSLLSRLGARSVKTSVSITSCRYASKGFNKAAMGQSRVRRDRVSHRDARDMEDMSDDEVEEVEDKLQTLFNKQRKEQRTVKYHILRRQMTPPGAPQRKLTWDAIEQIKYLKQEHPEEWTVERLAEGYSVTPDVIRRVLKSKFVPAPDKQTKQDAKVMAGLGQQALPSGAGAGQGRLKLPANRTPALLTPGSWEGAVVPVADKTLMLRGEGSGFLAMSPASVALLPTQFRAGVSDDVPETRSIEEDSFSNTSPTEEDDEESWDGRLFTEEELEEFMEMEQSCPVVQDGNDYFDAEGNFLYRI
ncbi:neugrin [Cottoperca gobio]|uniref:Neugrin n=1 Tax=Cottoperca gobio TaxID=56716 RepID=A0A6J2Q1U3_COTGO|nr:neugrin [Cottoperca gobio]